MTENKSTVEKINEFISEEEKNREVSTVLANLRKKVYEEILLKKAKILSLEEAVKAIKFAGVKDLTLEPMLNKMKSDLDTLTKKLTKEVESLISDDNKDDFVKILKETKFIHRNPIDYKFFQNLREETLNIIRAVVNEELVLLSPYKIAELVQSEIKRPALRKFIDLYKPETRGTNIDSWIEKYAKKEDDTQQIRVHFAEIVNENGFLTETMSEEIAIRWSIMLGLSGNMNKNPENREPLDPEMTQAVKDVKELLKKYVMVF